ncbi:SAM-dependent methyltransferase [Xinfangfangia pollutisoli]|uniref:SAM-dependent methyltransferase n=1 Tax=Xinfangfangia pollutisoli TaxID=2865960 RepID=UPI001CD3850C|nr:SAM-dependent methyltransferase [Xinfangfangia pollutisoli]
MTDLADPLRPHEQTVALPGGFDAGLWFIGRIRTPWTTRSACPRRGAPDQGPLCRIELDPRWLPALEGLAGRDRLQILYWMHLARRDAVLQNPDFGNRATGTFALRSPLRPNPIASSLVRLLSVEGSVLAVRGLDCVDGTPLLDLKPEFGAFA